MGRAQLVLPCFRNGATIWRGKRSEFWVMAAMFFYFDLGNVLLYFDHEIACRQMGAAAGTNGKVLSPEEVRSAVFESGLEDLYEAGKISTREFYDRFCEATGTRPDYQKLVQAACDIFWPNLSIKPVIGALRHARYRLGLLSNTNEAHWEYISRGRYGMLPRAFDVLALSYQMGTMKPSREIFVRAAELAGARPQEIFYVDDRAEHIAAACQVGYDAVRYTSTAELVRELRQRGIGLNY
jgi:HAD superfamily hydrolase (TIGR01509 family)